MNAGTPAPKLTPQRKRRNWLPALLLLAIVALAALVGLPRPVPPTEVPLPRIERTLEKAQSETERHLVVESLNHGLPLEVRAVGELLREFGRSEADAHAAPNQALKDPGLMQQQLLELRKAVHAATHQHGNPALLKLRSLQTRLFLQATRRPEIEGQPNADLLELGGALLEKARQNGWFQQGVWKAAEPELAAAYHIRWTRLLGLSQVPAFQSSLNDWRHYYRLRLRYPDSASRSVLDLTEARLWDVQALAKLDAAYPVHYARGVLTYQLGQTDQALEHFRKHLQLHPDGEWTLRARNALWACAVEMDR